MIGYIARRLITALIIVFGIAFITFAMLHYLSPSPVYDVLGSKAQPAAMARRPAEFAGEPWTSACCDERGRRGRS